MYIIACNLIGLDRDFEIFNDIKHKMYIIGSSTIRDHSLVINRAISLVDIIELNFVRRKRRSANKMRGNKKANGSVCSR